MATIAKDNIIVEFIANTAKFRKERRAAMAEAEKDTQKTAGRISRIADIAGGFLSAQLIQGAISGMAQLGTKALELSKNYEQTLVSFELFTGSLENAEALVTKLDKFSLETPFEPTEINNAAKTLLGFGRSADIVLEDLNLIGNAAAASGADLGNLALVFGQVAGAGKLQGQDALQLINAGIPVYALLAESLGVSQAEVKRLQSAGEITFETLREGFAKASAEGGKFEGALVKQSQTFAGLVSTAQGAFDSLLRVAGDAFLPIIKEILPPVIEGLFFLVNVVKNSAVPVIGLIKSGFDAVKNALSPVTEALSGLFSQFSGGEGILSRFQAPLTFLAQTLTVVGKVLGFVIDGVSAFFTAIGNSPEVQSFVTALQTVPAVIGGIIRVAETLPTAIGEQFSKSKLIIQAFLSDLLTVLNPINIGRLIAGAVTFEELTANGAKLRAAASEFKGFGTSVADAFEVGYREIENIQVELPEVATEENKKVARDGGEEVGKETAKGLIEGVKKQLAASSLAGIKEQISALQKIIEEVADPAGDGISTLVDSLGKITDKEEELARIQDLIDRINGDKTVEAVERLPEQDRLDGLAEVALAEAANLVAYNEGLKERRKGEAELAAQRAEALRAQGEQILQGAVNLADQLISIQEEKVDREISLQEDRLSQLLAVADQGNAEQLQLEEQRLSKLQKEKEKAVQARQRLAAIEIAVNNAVAASESIKAITAAFAAGNIPLGIATSAALALTVASTVLTVANAFGDIPSFRVGTDDFQPGKADSTGGALAMLHTGERVLTAEQNASLKAWGVRNEQIPQLVGMALGRIGSPSIVTAAPQTDGAIRRELSELKRAMRDVTRAIKTNPTNVIFDEKGLYTAGERQARKARRKARLRRG